MLSSRFVTWIGLSLALLPWHAIAATCSSTSSDPAQVVNAQFAAYNAHDVDAFAACYADDVSIISLDGKRPPIKGITALKQVYAFLNKEPKTFRVEIIKRMVNGPIVVDVERVYGLPPGKHLPDMIAMYEVRNGKVLNAWFPPSE